VLAFFSARTLSLVGNAMAPAALAFAVLKMPGHGHQPRSGADGPRRRPHVFVLIGGIVADRFPQHRVMVAADVAAGLAQAAVAVLVITGRASPGVQASPGGRQRGGRRTVHVGLPVRNAAVGLRVLQAANGLLQLSVRGGSILGAAFAGVLVSLSEAGATLMIDATSSSPREQVAILARRRPAVTPTPTTWPARSPTVAILARRRG
jgi:hypothetical protein